MTHKWRLAARRLLHPFPTSARLLHLGAVDRWRRARFRTTLLWLTAGGGARASDTVGALLARRDHMNQRLSFREMVYLLLADPSSGPLARAFGVLMWIVITLSCFCFMYETMRWVTDLTGPLPWLYAKMTFQIFYTAEACARLLSFVPFRQAYKDAFVWLDVLTAIPFWMRFFLYPDSLTAESYLDNTAGQ